jgi:hypothetical protein
VEGKNSFVNEGSVNKIHERKKERKVTAERENAVTCWLTKRKETREEIQLVCCV